MLLLLERDGSKCVPVPRRRDPWAAASIRRSHVFRPPAGGRGLIARRPWHGALLTIRHVARAQPKKADARRHQRFQKTPGFSDVRSRRLAARLTGLNSAGASCVDGWGGSMLCPRAKDNFLPCGVKPRKMLGIFGI